MLDVLTRQCLPVRFQLPLIQDSLTPEQQRVFASLAAHFEAYCAHHALVPDQVCRDYTGWLEAFSGHLRRYIASGLYPVEYRDGFTCGRIVYDLCLMLSTLVTRHRFRLMEKVAALPGQPAGRALVLGVGAGLELALLEPRWGALSGFDMQLDEFVRRRFPQVTFHDRLPKEGSFDGIFAIELLEHLADPYGFLARLAGLLRPGSGRLVVTTARNIPQWDHLHNFHDPRLFRQAIAALGWRVVAEEIIPHRFQHEFSGFEADNGFFVLERAEPAAMPCQRQRTGSNFDGRGRPPSTLHR